MKKLIVIFSLLCVHPHFAQNIVLQEFVTGLSNPVEIAHANDARLFIVQQNGVIKIAQPTGTVNTANFIDLSAKISFSGEKGLLGLAFHPQYSTNGYFFVFYNNTAGNITLARYSVNGGNPDIADIASEKILLNITKPFDNHNGGSIHFAPDGNLWISTGDGGSGGDPGNNSQNKNSLLGKILRIDVNTTASYNIPADNPFVNGVGADEIWSYGLRNAWKFSFDLTGGNVLIADVGQSAFEEINRMPIYSAGINYGWRCYEGNNSYNTTGCPPMATTTFPLAIYDHSGGKCSITGGYVYRGNAYPVLAGKYIFADYCSKQIGILNTDNSVVWTAPFAGNNFATFGQDFQKELYIAAVNSGKIYKVTTTTLATDNNTFSKISISPNPASEYLIVQGLTGKSNTADFINMEGRIVLETQLRDNGRINLSTLKSGVYFVTIRSDQVKIYSQKVIVK